MFAINVEQGLRREPVQRRRVRPSGILCVVHDHVAWRERQAQTAQKQ
jgi:hypothetical protein